MMTKISAVLATLMLMAMLCTDDNAYGAIFNPADEEEFRNALQSSETNGEDNTILLPEAIFDTDGEPFAFNPSDTGALMIIGSGLVNCNRCRRRRAWYQHRYFKSSRRHGLRYYRK